MKSNENIKEKCFMLRKISDDQFILIHPSYKYVSQDTLAKTPLGVQCSKKSGEPDIRTQILASLIFIN